MTPRIEVQGLRLAYGAKEVIRGISFEVFANEILGVIGPAQSGKTSLLRCINRTIDFTPNASRVDSLVVPPARVIRTKTMMLMAKKTYVKKGRRFQTVCRKS